MDKNTFYTEIGTKQVLSKNSPVPQAAGVELSSSPDVHIWAKDGSNNFYPVNSVASKLDKGVYEVKMGFSGVCFSKVNLVLDSKILNLSNSVVNSVNSTINNFLKSKQTFASYNFPYRKGIIIYGNRKSGKTTSIYSVIKSFPGIVLQGTHPLLLKTALTYLKSIEDDTPILVNLDNLNNYISEYDSKSLIDLLDESTNVIYLASSSDTATLPRELITVERFSTIDFIKDLTSKDREIYLTSKLPQVEPATVKSLAEKTKEFSIPELNSLIITVLGHGNNIEESISRIKFVPKASVVELVPVDLTKKKVLKTFYYDENDNVKAIVDEEIDDIVKVKKDTQVEQPIEEKQIQDMVITIVDEKEQS